MCTNLPDQLSSLHLRGAFFVKTCTVLGTACMLTTASKGLTKLSACRSAQAPQGALPGGLPLQPGEKTGCRLLDGMHAIVRFCMLEGFQVWAQASWRADKAACVLPC